MLRRQAVSILLGAAATRANGAAAPLGRFFDSADGSALLVGVHPVRLIGAHKPAVAAGFLAPPGSTLKPFVLSALLKSRKLAPDESILCPGRLSIANRSFNCSHPHLETPMQPHTALAYSCNYYVAEVADRFAPGELARQLDIAGLGARSGLFSDAEASARITPARTTDAIRLQALGEEGIAVTLAELALAYRSLALHAEPAIRSGLEEAVEFGTAQRAQLAGVKVAGKTGSVRTSDGLALAWFAGFLPSSDPQVAVAVSLQGRSGGSDAAPVAARILEAWRQGKL